jgi:hypothetical protein
VTHPLEAGIVNQRRYPLLGNGAINTFQRSKTYARKNRGILEAVFFVGSVQRLHFDNRKHPLRLILTFNGRNIHFLNHVKSLGAIFDKRITWRLHIEMIEGKVFKNIY